MPRFRRFRANKGPNKIIWTKVTHIRLCGEQPLKWNQQKNFTFAFQLFCFLNDATLESPPSSPPGPGLDVALEVGPVHGAGQLDGGVEDVADAPGGEGARVQRPLAPDPHAAVDVVGGPALAGIPPGRMQPERWAKPTVSCVNWQSGIFLTWKFLNFGENSTVKLIFTLNLEHNHIFFYNMMTP